MNSFNESFMARAIELSQEKMRAGLGGPFGALVVKDGVIIAEGFNQVTSLNDPTAHAEVTAIRAACHHLQDFQLSGCELYTSCEPCPMCLGAIYWARPDMVYYANTREDAGRIGFDDDFIYQEIGLPPGQRKIPMAHTPMQSALDVFQEWETKGDKTSY